MLGGRKPGADEPAEPERPHYWRIDASGPMRDRLLSVMRKQAHDPLTASIIETLELAERLDLPFTPPVDWDALERRARDGYDVVDQIWDAKRKGDPPC